MKVVYLNSPVTDTYSIVSTVAPSVGVVSALINTVIVSSIISPTITIPNPLGLEESV